MSDFEEDDGEPDSSTQFKPSFVLIAIDTHPSMFVKAENDDRTCFRNCINACYNLANSLIFTQNKRSWSPFGVVLAHEDAKASFVNFNDNVLNSIKFLKGKTKATDVELRDEYQRKGTFDLSGFFLFCKKKFKEVNSVFYRRIIIYITNDDNPVAGDKNQRFAALNEAKNFEANSMSFEIVTMNSNFNYTHFYNELFSVMKVPLIETIAEDEDGLFEKLSSSILTRFYQRKLMFFPFLGDEKRFLTVRQKAFIRDEKIYNNAFMSTDGKMLKKISRNVADATKTYLLKNGPRNIEFSMEEHMEILNNSLQIGYTLVYVSDPVTELGSVLIDNVILEVDSKETLPYFDSFWQYCVDKNKVLVCARKLRKLDKLRFVEFIPKFANNTKVFLIKAIPFNDEYKYPPSKLVEEDPQTQYSPEKVKLTNDLINKLTFDFDPKMFTDPINAKKKAFLRSKLLEESKDDVDDVTLDKEGIDKSLGQIGEEFKNLFHLEEAGAKLAKRRNTPASAAEKSKRGKKK